MKCIGHSLIRFFPPKSPQIAAVSNDIADGTSASQEQDQQQESDPDVTLVENGFDDDVIDNSISLFAVGRKLYHDDPDFDDDCEEMLQMYPVTRCPVCIHCGSIEHKSHQCSVVFVDATDGYDEVPC